MADEIREMKRLKRVELIPVFAGALAVIILLGWLVLKATSGPPPVEGKLRAQVSANGSLPALKRIAFRCISGNTREVASDGDLKYVEDRGVKRAFIMLDGKRTIGVFYLFGGGADSKYGIMVVQSGVQPHWGEFFVNPWGNDVWFASQFR